MKVKAILVTFAAMFLCIAAGAKKYSCITEHASQVTQYTAQLNATAVFQDMKEAGFGHFYLSDKELDQKNLAALGSRYAAGEIPVEGGMFRIYLTDLVPGTTYYYMASVVVGGKEKFGAVESFYTPEKPDRLCLTGDAEDITISSAKLTGLAFPSPEFGTVRIGFICSQEENPTLENGSVLESWHIGDDCSYSVTAGDLASGETYYYRSFLEYGGLYRIGAVKSFTTSNFTASVKTLEPVLEGGIATIGGELTCSTGVEGSLCSLYYMIADEAPTRDALLSGGTRIVADLKSGANLTGSFKAGIDQLRISRKYFCLAAAVINGRSFVGDVKCFETPGVEVATVDAAVPSVFSAEVAGRTESLAGRFGFLVSDRLSTIEGLIEGGTAVEAVLAPGDSLFRANVMGLNPSSEYYYAATLSLDGLTFYGDVFSFSTGEWPEFVDMGDGLLWRSCNLGAKEPSAFGDYYSWGEVKTKAKYDWDAYKWNVVNWSDSFTKYCFDSIYGNNSYSDNKTVLEPADDAVAQVLKNGWRMPTRDECARLLENPDVYECTEVSINGVRGMRILCKTNSNWIFLPYAGFKEGPALLETGHGLFYWTSSLCSSAVFKGFTISGGPEPASIGAEDRFKGLPMRPVKEK